MYMYIDTYTRRKTTPKLHESVQIKVHVVVEGIKFVRLKGL